MDTSPWAMPCLNRLSLFVSARNRYRFSPPSPVPRSVVAVECCSFWPDLYK